MASIDEAIRRLIFQYVSEGADKVMQTQEAVAASTTKTDKASLSLEKSFGNLERRYVETVRHQQDYQKVQQQVNAAVAQNPALQERANVVLAAAAEHYDKLALNANKGGVAASFLSKAFSTMLGPAGLIGIAITAVGAAVVYVVDKFQLLTQAVQWASTALGAVGFEQAAQSVANYAARMREVHEATEKQKAAIKEIQALHPKISEDVAKQLQTQQAQLTVAQARTSEEKINADLLLKEVEYNQANLGAEEKRLLLAGDRAIAEAKVIKAIEDQQIAAEAARDKAIEQATERARAQEQAMERSTEATKQNTQVVLGANQVYDQLTGHILDYTQSIIFWATTMADVIEDAMDMVPTQFGDEQFVSSWDPAMIELQKENLERIYGAENIEAVKHGAGLGEFVTYQPKQSYLNQQIKPGETTSEMLKRLADKMDSLGKSTDALNATMQDALSPFYSQDPRTTKLGFRAGVTGNPDWMTGATNANPLVAVLGAGATAPGMADGGSFVVGGGYSANDNRMAVFPVASGEEIVVNRNKEGTGGQIVNIDNRIIVNGSVEEDTLSKMKVSRFQQAQRMRAGMAQAS